MLQQISDKYEIISFQARARAGFESHVRRKSAGGPRAAKSALEYRPCCDAQAPVITWQRSCNAAILRNGNAARVFFAEVLGDLGGFGPVARHGAVGVRGATARGRCARPA